MLLFKLKDTDVLVNCFLKPVLQLELVSDLSLVQSIGIRSDLLDLFNLLKVVHSHLLIEPFIIGLGLDFELFLKDLNYQIRFE